jgi:hypothetical protein
VHGSNALAAPPLRSKLALRSPERAAPGGRGRREGGHGAGGEPALHLAAHVAERVHANSGDLTQPLLRLQPRPARTCDTNDVGS